MDIFQRVGMLGISGVQQMKVVNGSDHHSAADVTFLIKENINIKDESSLLPLVTVTERTSLHILQKMRGDRLTHANIRLKTRLKCGLHSSSFQTQELLQ